MRHEVCRKAILDGEITDAVRAHQRRCESCRILARDLERVEALAPALSVPPAPAGLADRVVERMHEEWATTPRSAPRPAPIDRRRPRPWARPFAAAGVAAAVILAVILGLTPGGPQRALADSARKTEAAGTARVEMTANVLVEAEASGPDPQFRGVPVEMYAHVEAEWNRQMRDFERRIAEFEQRVDRQQEAFSRAIDDMFGQMPPQGPGRDAPAPTPPAAPRDPEPDSQEPERPTRVSSTVLISGSGSLDFRDGLDLRGSTRLNGSQDARAGFRVVAGPDGRSPAVEAPDGDWLQLPGAKGPLGSVVLDPNAALEILRSPRGDVEVTAGGRIDGRAVERYRFDVDGDALASRDAHATTWQADAWIDEDGLLRRMVLSSSSSRNGTRTETTLRLRLARFGADVDIGSAPAGSVRAPATSEGSLVIYPFGPSVQVAAGSSARGR